jgi:hypothetical protein
MIAEFGCVVVIVGNFALSSAILTVKGAWQSISNLAEF